MLRMNLRASFLAGVAFAGLNTQPALSQERVVVTGRWPAPALDALPNSSESVTAKDLAVSVNMVSVEDALKYLPNILIRKRHNGDTQSPMTTRTSGVGASARSLIFADGMLLSALIGNNNSFASPRWGMVVPEQIERIDVMYGPFAAQYAGNSIGAVVEIQTRMPDAFITTAHAQTSRQDFDQYGTKEDSYATYALSAMAGDRLGRFAWRASLYHLDSHNHPLAYVTATRPATPSAAGTPVTGAFTDLNRTGAPIAVLGAGGIEYQRQGNATLRLTYDIAPSLEAAYTVGLFLNDDRAGVQTYLTNGAGDAVYSGSLNIGGYAYSVPASAFANNIYRLEEEHWMHGAALRSASQGMWDWEIAASLYDYAKHIQHTPSIALPGAFAGGAGTITDMGGTGWYTGDAKLVFRPRGAEGAHQLSFGAHADRYRLSNLKYNTADWISGAKGALATAATGRTETYALWLQDVWRIAPAFKLTLGGRYESWRAFDGFNFALTPALSVNQPERDALTFSPKASLAWQPTDEWTVTASMGKAYRFPTVSELYQAVTTGAVLTVPNPNLKPENALSSELAVERMVGNGRMRFSLFDERISDALISQSAPLLPGSATLFNYVQNIDRVHSRGAEFVIEQEDVLVDGLALKGSVTYVDPRIVSNPVFPAAIGKRIPQVSAWRATGVATYRPDDRWAFTLAARYGSSVYATIDNSDHVKHTYQGFESYFVIDTRVTYAISEHWNAAVGIDNLNDRDYFLFHPFPRRSFIAELKYTY